MVSEEIVSKMEIISNIYYYSWRILQHSHQSHLGSTNANNGSIPTPLIKTLPSTKYNRYNEANG